jgi:hypothetical protein
MHNTFNDIIVIIVVESGAHMFRGRSLTFSLATPNDEWISLSPKMISGC